MNFGDNNEHSGFAEQYCDPSMVTVRIKEHFLSIRWNSRVPLPLVSERGGQRLSRGGFAMHDVGLAGWASETTEPFEKLGAVGMSREAVERFDVSADGHVLAVHAKELRAVL